MATKTALQALIDLIDPRHGFRGHMKQPETVAALNGLLVSAAGDTTPAATTYTILATDGFVPCNTGGVAFTVTLPTAVGLDGQEITIKKVDAAAFTVTVEGDGTETIDGALNVALPAQWDFITVRSDNANWHVVATNV